jgi:hypothetical protein
VWPFTGPEAWDLGLEGSYVIRDFLPLCHQVQPVFEPSQLPVIHSNPVESLASSGLSLPNEGQSALQSVTPSISHRSESLTYVCHGYGSGRYFQSMTIETLVLCFDWLQNLCVT